MVGYPSTSERRLSNAIATFGGPPLKNTVAAVGLGGAGLATKRGEVPTTPQSRGRRPSSADPVRSAGNPTSGRAHRDHDGNGNDGCAGRSRPKGIDMCCRFHDPERRSKSVDPRRESAGSPVFSGFGDEHERSAPVSRRMRTSGASRNLGSSWKLGSAASSQVQTSSEQGDDGRRHGVDRPLTKADHHPSDDLKRFNDNTAHMLQHRRPSEHTCKAEYQPSSSMREMNDRNQFHCADRAAPCLKLHEKHFVSEEMANCLRSPPNRQEMEGCLRSSPKQRDFTMPTRGDFSSAASGSACSGSGTRSARSGKQSGGGAGGRKVASSAASRSNGSGCGSEGSTNFTSSSCGQRSGGGGLAASQRSKARPHANPGGSSCASTRSTATSFSYSGYSYGTTTTRPNK